MKNTDVFTIRPLTLAEMHIPIDWAAAEGWNPGLHDAPAFHAADPGGFLVGELRGLAIAAISAVAYETSFGFIGFYLVHPEFRGHGYGLRLWQAAMQRLAGRNVGLDGVLAQQENYRKSGFKLAYRNIRHAGVTGGSVPSHPALVPLATVPLASIAAYDRQCFPEHRLAFVQHWIKQQDSHALAVVEGGAMVGYGMIRPCVEGFKIGPLFADNPQWADLLYSVLAGRVPAGQPLYLDTPETNPQALALATRHQMTVVFETARMYTGAFPDLAIPKIFGVTSFELG